ncbi:MAG TPA: hypothetical protein VNN15_02175 [Solirubrobacterales bacterium]|nr:hypothetical protein [Solirubrobacterales bacterium]
MGKVKLFVLAVVLAAIGVSAIGAGSASATLMCVVAPEGEAVLKCPEPGKFAYGVDFIPGSHIAGTLTGNATLELVGSGTVTCNQSTFTLALKTNGTSKAGEGITETSFKSGGGNCTAKVGVNTAAQVVAENLSYDATSVVYEGVASPQGSMTVAKAGGQVQYKIVLLPAFLTCFYQPSEALKGSWVNANGGTQSQVTFTGKTFAKTPASAAGCPEKMRLSATYNLKAQLENKEIYVASE